jgi:hypothetical protein
MLEDQPGLGGRATVKRAPRQTACAPTNHRAGENLRSRKAKRRSRGLPGRAPSPRCHGIPPGPRRRSACVARRRRGGLCSRNGSGPRSLACSVADGGVHCSWGVDRTPSSAAMRSLCAPTADPPRVGVRRANRAAFARQADLTSAQKLVADLQILCPKGDQRVDRTTLGHVAALVRGFRGVRDALQLRQPRWACLRRWSFRSA